MSPMIGMSKKHSSEPNIATINPEIQLNQQTLKISSDTNSKPELKRALPKTDLEGRESPRGQKLRFIKMLARKPENR